MRLVILALFIATFSFVAGAQSDCMKGASKFLKESTIKELSLDEKGGTYLEKEVLLFWKRHNSTLLLNPLLWSKKIKDRLTLKFQNLNDNKVPVFFIDDSEESFVKINRYVELVENRVATEELGEVEQEIVKSVDLWTTRYKSYVDETNKLLFEYLSYEMGIEQIRSALSKVKTFPHRESFVFIVDGKRIEKVKEFSSKDIMKFYMGSLRKERRAIVQDGVFGEGKLFQRKILQAQDHRRLTFLYHRVKDIVLTHKENGLPDHPELTRMISELELLLNDELNKPSPRFMAKLTNKELIFEIKDLIKTANDHAAVREGKKFYASLTPEQIRAMNLSGSGRSGELVQLVKDNKWKVLFTSMAGSGSVGGVLIAVKDFMMTDAERRAECAILEQAEAFMGCFESYMREKFQLSYPLKYLLKGDEALIKALNNPTKVSEFKAEYKIFLEIRAEYEKGERDERLFKNQFLQDLRKYMGEVGSPNEIEENFDDDRFSPGYDREGRPRRRNINNNGDYRRGRSDRTNETEAERRRRLRECRNDNDCDEDSNDFFPSEERVRNSTRGSEGSSSDYIDVMPTPGNRR